MIAAMTWWTHPLGTKPLSCAELCLWALSAKFARLNLGKLVLNTDKDGAELLVNGLGIEVDDLHLGLDNFDPGLPKVWAMGKIETYLLMAQRGDPFCHIDGDAILWKPLPENIIKASLFAQFSEANLPTVYPLHIFREYFSILPSKVSLAIDANLQNAYNLGIVGGIDMDFFANYAKEVLAIARNPANKIASEIDGAIASVLLEQYIFGCYAEHKSVETLLISPLEIDTAVGLNKERCVEVGFSHFWSASKREPYYASRIFARAEKELPGVVKRARLLSEV